MNEINLLILVNKTGLFRISISVSILFYSILLQGTFTLCKSTFGVKSLISSFRKRNLAASLWNLFPQLFIHASRTWKAPKINK